MNKSNTENIKIIVGLSGGVDSSVAALRLQQEGFQVEAVFMKNWEEDDDDEYCTAAVDLEDAKQVAARLGIELLTRNFSSEYWEHVFEYFLHEYEVGRTPNPDVLCNKEIKFKTFLEHAVSLGADHIATGHYARVSYLDGYYRLLKAVDPNKDQSYFLYLLDQYQLSKSLFPLGNLDKTQVRELAKSSGFENHAKKDSTGICFIGERKFKDFLSQYLPARPGDIHTPLGECVGKHNGLMFYTLGQRQGIQIGGRKNSSGEPWYVVEKNLDKNILVVGQGQHHPLLYSHSLSATQCHWIAAPPSKLPYHCTAKTRYRQADQRCIITHIDDQHCRVEFSEPQRAVTPGQSVVFYQGDECLGGGVIDSRW